MDSRPPLSEPIATTGRPGPRWATWFNQVFAGLPWKKGFNVTATLDFGPVPAQAQAVRTTTVRGARLGDAVRITAPDVFGVLFVGSVTADDTVSVYAKNFSAGAVDAPSQTFRIIVLQN